MSLSRTSWIQLTERESKPYHFYRRFEAFNPLEWGQIVLSDYDIAVCPFGGPLALMKRSKKDKGGAGAGAGAGAGGDDMAEGSGEGNSKTDENSKERRIYIYTNNGHLLNKISYKIKKNKEKEQNIHSFGWTDDMRLCVVTWGGDIHIYNIQGEKMFVNPSYSSLKLDSAKGGEFVCMTRFWAKGVAIYTTKNRLFVASDITQLFSASLTSSGTSSGTSKSSSGTTKSSSNSVVEDLKGKKNASLSKMNETSTVEETNVVFKEYVTAPTTSTVSTLYCMEVIPSEYSCVSSSSTSATTGTQSPMTGTSASVSFASDPKPLIEGHQSSGIEVLLVRNEDDTNIHVCTEKGTHAYDLGLKNIRNIRLAPDGRVLAVLAEDTTSDDKADERLTLHVIAVDFGAQYLNFSILQPKDDDLSSVDGVKEDSSFNLIPKRDFHNTQLSFCGDACVLISFPHRDDGDTTVLMVNCFSECYWFRYESPVYLCQEIDSTRIFSIYTCEILERVHSSTVDVFRIGSLEPCSLLYDAYSEYMKKEATTVKTIREIMYPKSETTDSEQSGPARLKDAIHQCIEAACRETNPRTQQSLLKAAAYGKNYLYSGILEDEGHNMTQILKNEDKNLFFKRCLEIRVLNEIRQRKYGFALTYDQFIRLSVKALIGRLVDMHHHYLAHKICRDFNLKQEEGRVLVHWACTKVNQPILKTEQQMAYTNTEEMTEEDKKLSAVEWKIYREIKYMFAQHKTSNISFAEIAMTAYRAGRTNLAKRLLQIDTKAMDQVPLYLSMHEIRLALAHATGSHAKDADAEKARGVFFNLFSWRDRQQQNASGTNGPNDQASSSLKPISRFDTDLVYLVILYLISTYKSEPAYLYELIDESPEAIRLFVNFCKVENVGQLEHYYKSTGQNHMAGMITLLDAYRNHSKNRQHFESTLAKAGGYFESGGKASQTDQLLTDSQFRLVQMQQSLEKHLEKLRKEDSSIPKVRFVGLKLHDTLVRCVIHKMEEKAFQLKDKLEVSEKRFWYAMVQGLAERKDWESLWKFYKDNAPSSGFASILGVGSKKATTPIGFEPFVDACLSKKNAEEALKYIPLVENLERKVRYYVQLGRFKDAIQAAGDAHDIDLLYYIRSQTENVKTRDTIDNVIAQIA